MRRADRVARHDPVRAGSARAAFRLGHRPVIRWVKGNGLDDGVTRTALAMATRIFGDTVDYCLCTNDLEADRVRAILAAATQPVEWWPQDPLDNPRLAGYLLDAGCPPERFGYWWKWFPDRVRPNAPEWVLDGDMVLVDRPPWFTQWARGRDQCRISRDDARRHPEMYGQYAELVDHDLSIYSGLVSLPPHLDYIEALEDVLRRQPLRRPHDGCEDMDEQGVVAVTFQELGAATFPLAEFPFARAFEEDLDVGVDGAAIEPWGYHFGNSFRMANAHFDRMVAEGTLHAGVPNEGLGRFDWLANRGQWGVPGWSINRHGAQVIAQAGLGAGTVLELGTSRGHLSAILAAQGSTVVTVDHLDRGAKENLAGLDVEVVVRDAREFLIADQRTFDLVVVDLHGNSERTWRGLRPMIEPKVAPRGSLALNNVALHELPEWRAESGVAWARRQLLGSGQWRSVAQSSAPPGVEVLARA
jgi:hypothetical protein